MTPARQRQILLAILGLACLVQLLLVILARLDQNRLDDDAYMFVRYARNALHYGAISWNPGEAPTYGLTSLGYFALVLLLETALRVDAAWVLLTATMISGGAFVAMAVWMAWRSTAAKTVSERSAAMLFVFLALAWGAAGLASHFVNGMDAAFALFFLTLYIIAICDWRHAPEQVRALWVGTLGGLALWVRPDILLYTLAVPLAASIFAPSTRHRRSALAILLITVVTGAALAGVAWAYFGIPLPLPAYSKVLHGYGLDMQLVYADFPAEQLSIFVRHHAVALLLAGSGILLLIRQRGIANIGIEIGLLGATLAFLIFHRFFVLAIMGSHQRFYYPMLPAILFLAAQTIVALTRTSLARKLAERLASAPKQRAFVTILACLAVLASLGPQTRNAWRSLQQESFLQNFSVLDNYRANWPSQYWIRLDGFSQLPDDLVIATTEVGYPGVMNPDKVIVDLAGLNDLEFARNGFSSQSLFSRYQPDLFLLPRSHYAALRRDISSSRTFRTGYEFFQPDPGLGIALRRDSRHYHDMRQVLGLQ